VGSRKWNRDNKGIKPPAERRPRTCAGTDYQLPRLRVVPDSNGSFVTVLGARPQTPGGEGWWLAVMNDWRTPRQTRHHFDRLGEHLAKMVVIACEECKLQREFHTAELLPIYGADYRMVYLRYDLAGCPAHRKFDECEVHYRGT
jgi:hypothetical protein